MAHAGEQLIPPAPPPGDAAETVMIPPDPSENADSATPIVSETERYPAPQSPMERFLAHIRRDPIAPNSGVRVIVLTDDSDSNDGVIPAIAMERAARLGVLTARLGRPWDAKIIRTSEQGYGRGLHVGQVRNPRPLTLITTMSESAIPGANDVGEWTSDHLTPLLEMIDGCDHVMAHPEISLSERFRSRLRFGIWRVIFALPPLRPDSPCQLHRSDALGKLKLQSDSGFALIELWAKAVYLRHVMTALPIPPLPSARWTWTWTWSDVKSVFQTPLFARDRTESPKIPKP